MYIHIARAYIWRAQISIYINTIMKIFVSIASFMDHQLEETIDSCLDNARFPDKINIAVCDQSKEFNQTIHDKVKYYTYENTYTNELTVWCTDKQL